MLVAALSKLVGQMNAVESWEHLVNVSTVRTLVACGQVKSYSW